MDRPRQWRPRIARAGGVSCARARRAGAASCAGFRAGAASLCVRPSGRRCFVCAWPFCPVGPIVDSMDCNSIALVHQGSSA